jgi:hypothetical protein
MLKPLLDQRARTPSENTRRLRGGGGAAAKARAGTTLARRAVTTSTTTALAPAAERGALATEGGWRLAVATSFAAIAVSAAVAAAVTTSSASKATLTRGARGAVTAAAEAAAVVAQRARRGAALLLLVCVGHDVVREVEVLAEVGDSFGRQKPVVVLPRETVAHELARDEGLHQLEDGEVAHILDLGVLLELLVIFGNHYTICTRTQAHAEHVSSSPTCTDDASSPAPGIAATWSVPGAPFRPSTVSCGDYHLGLHSSPTKCFITMLTWRGATLSRERLAAFFDRNRGPAARWSSPWKSLEYTVTLWALGMSIVDERTWDLR